MSTIPSLQHLLEEMVKRDATDLHITANSPPVIRIDGEITPMETYEKLTSAQTKQLAYAVLTDEQKHRFEAEKELDFSFGLKDLARFRANVFNQRGSVAATFRLIPWQVKSFEELGVSPTIPSLTERPHGLILVTGPTGSGKSTTLAALINKINKERQQHIITIEDPVEFLHPHHGCIVNQRELRADTDSYTKALKYVLRQDPDVVLIGEMRDLETIDAALRIAETGHLTLSTLHTNSTVETINRVIDVFPAHQQPQVRAQLSFVLEGVICQALLPHRSGTGRVLVQEIMLPNAAIRNLIREDKIHQIYSVMQAGQAEHGMQTFNQSLAQRVVEGKLHLDEAFRRSSRPDELKEMLERGHAAIRRPRRAQEARSR